MELESATDEIERLKKAVAELKTELDEAKCLVVDINDELSDAHNANECLRAENVKLNKRIINLEADMEGQCLGTKVALELNEEYRAKINELENDLSVQKGIVHVQDDCIDNMMDIFKVVESVCDKWEKAGKMMIKNDHHTIAGVALQKMAADIRAAL
jgi:chromosome segregation ATPase